LESYFAADVGSYQSHRIYVLENSNADPFEGEWQMKGKISDSSDKWAVDASVFEDQGELYMIWSGWEADENGTQNIYIARLSNPWTVKPTHAHFHAPVPLGESQRR
jgi:GH43 family beta-xylosidase